MHSVRQRLISLLLWQLAYTAKTLGYRLGSVWAYVLTSLHFSLFTTLHHRFSMCTERSVHCTVSDWLQCTSTHRQSTTCCKSRLWNFRFADKWL